MLDSGLRYVTGTGIFVCTFLSLVDYKLTNVHMYLNLSILYDERHK